MTGMRATRVEVIVVALIALTGVSLVLAARSGAEDAADRVACASNLRQVGQAMFLYANDHRMAFPRTVHDATTAARPDRTRGTLPRGI